jgi:hypothetical protein
MMQANIEVGTMVLKKNNRKADRKGGKNENPWIGLYMVYKKTDRCVFLERNGKPLQQGVNVNQVKKYYN